MKPAPIPQNDHPRVRSLEAMNLLSTAREADLDRITRTAQHVFATEIALVSLVDRNRQWFKSRCGLDAPQTPRDISFCGHAIHEEDIFVVSNATQDPRFFDNPLVTGGPKIRFYAGQPLTNDDGHRIGTLCVISTQPRTLDAQEEDILQNLGRMVEIVLSNRQLGEAQLDLLKSLEAAERDRLLDTDTGVWNRAGFDEMFIREAARAARAKAPIAVALINIDGFADATGGDPALGHALREQAAGLITSCSRSDDTVAGLDDGRFAVIAPGMMPSTLPGLGEKIVRTIRKKGRLPTPEGERAYTASVGLTLYMPTSRAPADPGVVLESAGIALAAAEAAGQDGFDIVGGADNLYANFALA